MLALGAVTYLDRACIATLSPDIRRDLGLGKEQMSWIYSAFAIAYAAFEIPTAWWADRMGTRRVLTRIVSWWSAFTMASAAAWNFWVDAGHPLSVWCRRGWRVAEHGADFLTLDPEIRTRYDPGHLLCCRACFGRIDTADRARGGRPVRVALDVRDLWHPRHRVGHRLAPLVSQ